MNTIFVQRQESTKDCFTKLLNINAIYPVLSGLKKKRTFLFRIY